MWNRKKICKYIKIFIILGIFIFTYGLGHILIDICDNKGKFEPVKYVIVLGAGIEGNRPKDSLKYRLDEAILYWKIYPKTIFIVSGGIGKNKKYSESYVMKNYLEKNGIPSSNILEENKSKSTIENLKYSMKLFPKNEKVGIITNDFHMYRTKYFANKLNIEVFPIYAKTPPLKIISNYTRESLAIIYYKLKEKLFRK